MFISEEEAQNRLNSADNLINVRAQSFVDKMISAAHNPNLFDASNENTKHIPPICEKQEVINKGTVYSASAAHNKQRPQNEVGDITQPPEIRPIVTKQKGDKKIPHFMKVIIAADAQMSTARQAAAQFNVAASSADRFKNDPSLRPDVEKRLGAVRDVAMDKLMMSLGLLDETKVGKASAKDISAIAANMSRVVEKSIPQQNNSNQVQIILYAPQQKVEADYEVITPRDQQNPHRS